MRPSIAVLLLLVLAPAAHAGALPPAGVVVGGGGLPDDATDARLISMRVGGDGRTVRIAGSLISPCTRKFGLGRVFAGRTRLADDGSFDVTLPGRQPDGPGFFKGRGDVHVRGSFDGTRATGAMAVTPGARMKVKGRTRSCPSVDSPYEVRDPGRPSGTSSDVAPGQTLFGLGSDRRDGLPIGAVARTRPAGRRLDTVYVGIDVDCKGELKTFNNVSPRMTVDPAGAFRNVERFTIGYSNAISRYRAVTTGHYADGGAIVGRLSLRVHGRFTEGSAKGRRYRCRRAGATRFALVP